jgi:hypothetical protein
MDPFRIFLLIFICFISGIVLWSLISSFLRVRRSHSSWLQTTGRIISFGINYGTPSISYEYEAQGEVFTGTKFTPGPKAFYPKGSGTSFPKSFYFNESGQLRFSPGNSVEVFYDPRNPGDSALVREMPSGKGFLLVVPVIAFFVVLYIYPAWFSSHVKVLLPVGFMVAGLAVFIYGCTWMRRHWQTRSFPSVRGRLLQAKAVYATGGGDSGSGYSVSVEFEYEVNGCLYRSQKLRDLPLTILESSRQGAEQQMEKLRADPTPEIFYDPVAPWDGFLLRTNLLGSLSPILLSIPFVGMGTFLLMHHNSFHWR